MSVQKKSGGSFPLAFSYLVCKDDERFGLSPKNKKGYNRMTHDSEEGVLASVRTASGADNTLVIERRLRAVLKNIHTEGFVRGGRCTENGDMRILPYYTTLRKHVEWVVRDTARKLHEMPFERRFILLLAMEILSREDIIPMRATSRNILALLSAVSIVKDPHMVRFFTIRDGRIFFNTDHVDMRRS